MMDRYTSKLRGNRQSQQQQTPSPCNIKNNIRGSSNGSSTVTTNSAAPKRVPEKRGPDAASLLSQLHQLDELASFATNSSIRRSNTNNSRICAESSSRSAVQITESNSLEEIDQIVQAVSSKLSMSQSVGSVASDCFSGAVRLTRSMGSEGSGNYSFNNRNVPSASAVTTSVVGKAPSTGKTSVGPMLSNSSDDVELSATKWYTHRRTTSVDSMEDSSSEESERHQIYSDDEIFDLAQKLLKDDSELSKSLPANSLRRSSSSSSSSSSVTPKKSPEFDDVWEDGEEDTVDDDPERLTFLESATTGSTETEEDEIDEDNSASSSPSEEVDEYESDDASSELYEEESIPPPPPVQTSTSINSQQHESSPLASLDHQNNPEKTENDSDSAEDYSDDDDEGEEGYKLGGYHPVNNGEVYNQRLVRSFFFEIKSLITQL